MRFWLYVSKSIPLKRDISYIIKDANVKKDYNECQKAYKKCVELDEGLHEMREETKKAETLIKNNKNKMKTDGAALKAAEKESKELDKRFKQYLTNHNFI